MPEAGWETAYIGIGSNVEPEVNIPRALELLAERARLRAISTFYRTAALDRPGQPDFLNGACRIETDLDPRRLKFETLRDIEARLGRRRTADKYGPCTIDLDVLLYGRRVCDEPDLRIPDPDIRARPFVAAPLLELAPDAVLPDTGEPLAGIEAARALDRLTPDLEFTREVRQRFSHECGTCGGVGA